MSKEVVQCVTQEQWDFVTKTLNYKWYGAEWTDYKEDTCIVLHENLYGSIENMYKKTDYKIYTFKQWCDKFNHKPDFVKDDKPMFEVGKWYKRTDYTGEDYQKSWKLYFKISNVHPGTLDCSETIDVGGIYKKDDIARISPDKIEVPLIEIQKFLPNDHPDKFKTMNNELTELPERWCIKVTNENIKELVKWRDWGDCLSGGEGGYLGYDKIWITKVSNRTEITFEQFKKWVLKDDEKPVKAPRFKSGDKVCIPRTKMGEPWYKNNESHLDDYKEDYFILKGTLTPDNMGLYRADKGRFGANSFYESDLVPYIEPVKEKWIPKVGEWIYAEKAESNDFRTKENVPLFKLEEIHISYKSTYLRPKKGDSTGVILTTCRKAEPWEIPVIHSFGGTVSTSKIKDNWFISNHVPQEYPKYFLGIDPINPTQRSKSSKTLIKLNKLPTKSWY